MREDDGVGEGREWARRFAEDVARGKAFEAAMPMFDADGLRVDCACRSDLANKGPCGICGDTGVFPSPAAAPETVHNGRGSLTVTMRVPESFARADADVDALSDPKCSQIIRTDVDSLYFHRLRLRVAQDPSLAEHITVLYTDAEGQQHRVGLLFEDELRWPPGFEHELWENENAIGAVRASPIAAPASLITCGCGVNGRMCREHAAEFDAVTLSRSRPHPLVTRNAELESQVRTLQEENEAMREEMRQIADVANREAFAQTTSHRPHRSLMEIEKMARAALSSKTETAE